MSLQTPIFEGVLNAYPLANLLANGPPDDPPGIRKKAVCVSKRNAIHFRVRGCPTPFRQLADQNAKNMCFSRGF
jgi:hypothetical protein